MEATIVTPEYFNSPCCDVPFEEDDLMELGQEPFNGIIAECPECNKEWSCDMLIKMTEV